jgi:hypothetical protein
VKVAFIANRTHHRATGSASDLIARKPKAPAENSLWALTIYCGLLPDFIGNLLDKAQLCPLLFFGEDIALLGRCKTALGADA